MQVSPTEKTQIFYKHEHRAQAEQAGIRPGHVPLVFKALKSVKVKNQSPWSLQVSHL